jgi:hypothetical protein
VGVSTNLGYHCNYPKKHNGLEDHTSVEDSGMVPKSSRTQGIGTTFQGHQVFKLSSIWKCFSSNTWSFGIVKHIFDMFEKNLWPHHDFDLRIICEI